MVTWVLFAFLLATGCHAEADPEAQAEPDADPNPLPEPQYQSYGGPAQGMYGQGLYGQQGMYGPGPGAMGSFDYEYENNDLNPNFDTAFQRPDPNQGMNPNPDPGFSRPDQNTCALTEQCCNMNTQNCCPNPGKKCYTVWERKCSPGVANVQCPVTTKTHCHDVQVPECRLVTKIERKEFEGERCEPVMVRKCFDYTAKVCDDQPNTKQVTVDWDNQQIKVGPSKTEEHCETIQENKCISINNTQTIEEWVNVPYTEIQNKTNCINRYKQMPSSQRTITDYTIQYKRACYDRKIPDCTPMPCATTGECDTGSQPCSTDQTSSQTVCPDLGSTNPGFPPNTGCQQVQQPVCGQTQFCGYRQPPYQQCCRWITKKVCVNIPIRVPTQRTITIPGGWKVVPECNTIPFPVTKYRPERRERQVNRPYKDCKPSERRECHNYTIPEYETTTLKQNATVEIALPKCNPQEKQMQLCENLPLDTRCVKYKIPKNIRITYSVCDQKKVLKQCFKVAIANCYKYGMSPGQCQMVPRQVCQPTCEQNDYCNTCAEFVNNGPGFGNCPTSTCGNAIMPFGNETTPYPGGQVMPSYPNYQGGPVPLVEAGDDFDFDN